VLVKNFSIKLTASTPDANLEDVLPLLVHDKGGMPEELDWTA
jgi:hypothetical protein